MNEARSPSVRIYFDATRLLSRGNATPTGIDRVDLAYVKALSVAPDFDLRLITFDVFGAKLLSRQQADGLIAKKIRQWQLSETSVVGSSPLFKSLAQWLGSPLGTPCPVLEVIPTELSYGERKRLFWLKLKSARDMLLMERSRGQLQSLPSVYLNTSHGRLDRKTVANWLRTTQIGAVFFVHDLIPIEFPEFNRPKEPIRHAARLATISKYARRVLVNSESTRSTLADYLYGCQRRVPPISVLPLGVESRFTRVEGPAEVQPAAPYFVILGTIEPRKNHKLLLQSWAHWIATGDATVPRLVVLGRRGWENRQVFKSLDEPIAFSRHIVECGGLSDAEVGALLRSARALLCPSFAEGFSLPVVEALASRTPVIASDIPAHREVAGPYAEYLSPFDPPGWLQAMKDYAMEHSQRRESQLRQLQNFRAPDWEAHFSRAKTLLYEAAVR
ncbi:MAG: glycosyltransferase family 4 protein [Stenotrophobium sp.]